MTIQPGIRINYDKKDGLYNSVVSGTASDGTRQLVLFAGPYANDPWIVQQRGVLAPQRFAPKFSAWNFSYDLTASYRLSADILAFATYAHTFKSGGIKPISHSASRPWWNLPSLTLPYPFDRISAYKVRESRDNLQHNLKTVGSIAEYLRARPRDRHSSMLVGCAEDDKAYRLKQVPEIIARELGYNLIPAIEALTVEGVPAADVTKYMRAILPDINRLINECDAIQKATARAIKFEYEAMKASRLGMERICAAALRIAEDSVKFCDQHGV